MFIAAALFTISKTRKQPKCTPTDEKIKKIWCTYTMGYYLATFAATQMDLEFIILSEVHQKKIDKPCVISLTWAI